MTQSNIARVRGCALAWGFSDEEVDELVHDVCGASCLHLAPDDVTDDLIVEMSFG